MQRVQKIMLFVLSIFVVSLFVGIAHTQAATPKWQTELINISIRKVYIQPEKDITVVATFKNIGSETWHNKKNQRGYVALNVRQKSQFEHKYWLDWEHPCVIKEETVAPLNLATCAFAFKAPSAMGTYTLEMELASERVAWIKGGKIELPVIVTIDPEGAKRKDDVALAAKQTAQNITNDENVIETIAALEQIPEPLDFRVGLFYRNEPLKITNWGMFHMTDPNGNILGTYGQGTILTVIYSRTSGDYSVTTPSGNTTRYKHYVRFVPALDNKNSIFELTNYDTRPKWNPNINENRYRGIIEYRHNPRTDNIWTINELPLETYMKGIGEIGEKAPMDALKASAIAVRGYALDLYQKNSKYFGFIHAITTQSDQLFGGYEQEKRRPNFQKAVSETRGIVATYQNKPVVTPYFSQSKGETMSSQEVWGGLHKPWLVRVNVPCDAGMRGIGHGVGMSQQASICMAQQGMNYQTIMKHFYTGIELQKVY